MHKASSCPPHKVTEMVANGGDAEQLLHHMDRSGMEDATHLSTGVVLCNL